MFLSAALAIVLAVPAMAQGSPQFNSFSGKYEMALPDASPQFNSFTSKYEMAGPGATPQFNSFTGQYEMAVPGAQYVALPKIMRQPNCGRSVDYDCHKYETLPCAG